MITGTDIENRERDLSLQNRGGEERPARKRSEPPELRVLREEAAQLREDLAASQLRAQQIIDRLEAARKIKPKGADLHCARCFGAGRDAALRAVEGNGKG